MFVTSQYSFRLLQNYTAPPDWKGAFERAKGRIAVVGGADDELMDADAYKRVLPPLGIPVTIVPGVDHMGIVYRPEAIKAILAAMAETGAYEEEEPDVQIDGGGPLRARRIRAAHHILDARRDARRQASDPRLDPVHRRRRRMALAKGAQVHAPLSPGEWADARIRPHRSRLDLAVHAQIRSGDHQRGDRPCLRRRRARGKADHPGGRRAARRDFCRDPRGARLLSPVHPRLGGILLPQGRVLPLDGLDPSDARGDGATLCCRKRQSWPDDRCQRDAGPAALLPLPSPRPLAQARTDRSGDAGALPASQT